MGAGTEEDPKWLCSKPNMYLENGLVPLSYFGQLLENIKSHAFENSGAGTATYWGDFNNRDRSVNRSTGGSAEKLNLGRGFTEAKKSQCTDNKGWVSNPGPDTKLCALEDWHGRPE